MKTFWLACMGIFLLAPLSFAQSPQPQGAVKQVTREKVLDLLDYRLSKKDARTLLTHIATTVTQSAHPTGSSPDLLGATFGGGQNGVVQITMKVEYFGGFSGKRYLGTIHFWIDRSDEADLYITRLDFVDMGNSIPPNRENISLLKKAWNRTFAE